MTAAATIAGGSRTMSSSSGTDRGGTFWTAGSDSRRASRPAWLRILRAVVFILCSALLVGSPWWGPLALSRLDYFHVRRLEFEGVRYAKTGELVSVIGVDTTQSVWQSLPPLAARVRTHPMVAGAQVERRLPGTLVVHIVEREPIALTPISGVLRPTDVTGHELPIDPTRVPLDVPLVSSADSALLQLLDGMRLHAPALFGRVTEAKRVGAEEMQFVLGPGLRVRTRSDVSVARFRDILPVEADLARNHLRAVEFDLRFRDQVIARQP